MRAFVDGRLAQIAAGFALPELELAVYPLDEDDCHPPDADHVIRDAEKCAAARVRFVEPDVWALLVPPE